jgi:hypothetical protein
MVQDEPIPAIAVGGSSAGEQSPRKRTAIDPYVVRRGARPASEAHRWPAALGDGTSLSGYRRSHPESGVRTPEAFEPCQVAGTTGGEREGMGRRDEDAQDQECITTRHWHDEGLRWAVAGKSTHG